MVSLPRMYHQAPVRRQGNAASLAVAFAIILVVANAAGSTLFSIPVRLFSKPISMVIQGSTGQGARPRAASTQMHAAENEDLPAKAAKKEWEAPFPKYIVGFGILLFLVGYIGGGSGLAIVFGISGAGFGALFEPFQTDDGTVSGLQ